jgi:hypothetical protein
MKMDVNLAFNFSLANEQVKYTIQSAVNYYLCSIKKYAQKRVSHMKIKKHKSK